MPPRPPMYRQRKVRARAGLLLQASIERHVSAHLPVPTPPRAPRRSPHLDHSGISVRESTAPATDAQTGGSGSGKITAIDSRRATHAVKDGTERRTHRPTSNVSSYQAPTTASLSASIVAATAALTLKSTTTAASHSPYKLAEKSNLTVSMPSTASAMMNTLAMTHESATDELSLQSTATVPVSEPASSVCESNSSALQTNSSSSPAIKVEAIVAATVEDNEDAYLNMSYSQDWSFDDEGPDSNPHEGGGTGVDSETECELNPSPCKALSMSETPPMTEFEDASDPENSVYDSIDESHPAQMNEVASDDDAEINGDSTAALNNRQRSVELSASSLPLASITQFLTLTPTKVGKESDVSSLTAEPAQYVDRRSNLIPTLEQWMELLADDRMVGITTSATECCVVKSAAVDSETNTPRLEEEVRNATVATPAPLLAESSSARENFDID